MAWNTAGYSDFFATASSIENPLSVDVRVDPISNGGATVLSVYTGTALVGGFFHGAAPYTGLSSAAWSRGLLTFHVPTPGRVWQGLPLEGPDDPTTFFMRGAVVVSLASIFNEHVANNAGWAVDGADVRALALQEQGLVIQAKIAVRDSDGHLYRVSYQVTALGSDNRPKDAGLPPT
jgi:hypothetical protein